MKLDYQQARKDYETLEKITEVRDLVEIDSQVFDLMREPTKAKAQRMYESCIYFWFQENRHPGNPHKKLPVVQEIYRRWQCRASLPLW